MASTTAFCPRCGGNVRIILGADHQAGTPLPDGVGVNFNPNTAGAVVPEGTVIPFCEPCAVIEAEEQAAR